MKSVIMLNQFVDYHLTMFNFTNNVIWSITLIADVNSMDLIYGAGGTYANI